MVDVKHLWKFWEHREPALIVWADQISHVVFRVPRHSHEDAKAAVDWHNRIVAITSVDQSSKDEQ